MGFRPKTRIAQLETPVNATCLLGEQLSGYPLPR
jgi:hypothetical protein